jgi:CRISPR-associated endonuclease/helicase Cas3
MNQTTFNSIESVEELITNALKVDEILKDSAYYYAHVMPKGSPKNKKPELLHEHINLVQSKFCRLVKTHNLDTVINRLIIDLAQRSKLEVTSDILNFIKELWVNTIVFHDFGKVNENFQADETKMNNPFFKGKERLGSPLSTHHSSLGAYLYVVYHTKRVLDFERKYSGVLTFYILGFSYSIFKHHGKYLGDNSKEKIRFLPDEVTCMKTYIAAYGWVVSDTFSENIPKSTAKIFNDLPQLQNSFSFYNLIRLSFSLLTASDFLASGEYMTGLEVTDFGVLSKERIDAIYNHVSTSEWINEAEQKRNYNKDTFNLAATDYSFVNPTGKNNKNLNILRREMGIEALQKVRQFSHKNLFYIEAPTGGGKTNVSFLAAIELLKLNEGLNKVYYVFPFTTLVTQTQKALTETLGLSEDEVIMLSSKSGFKEKEQAESTQEQDEKYRKQKEFYLDNLFCFFPFCLMTHIKFFNILKTNEKSENYLLHRLANSVVVIDELQAYSPNEWQKVMYFIQNYAHFYNIKFIVMSATLPKLDKLDIFKNQELDFVYLLENPKKDYFQNPNFRDRVKFRFDLLEEKKITLEKLSATLLEKSAEYALQDFGKAKPKGSVYTIIEFIFKKTATEFYSIIEKENGGFFEEIYVLSGTILEHRRKQIINVLKNPINRQKKILLITTQVVEAGVDIDMDLGFKDKSLIDSDEQLAGRINRNVNKEGCELYLFDYNNDKLIYGNDLRHQNTRKIQQAEYERVLREKDFDSIYNKVLDGINEQDSKANYVSFSEYEAKIHQLKFQSAHFDFKLINNEQQNLSVFIPLDIPVVVDGVSANDKESIFSPNELGFLQRHGVLPDMKGAISGSNVFDVYLSLRRPNQDFTGKKIDERVMQGILSKFMIQLIGSDKVKNHLIHFSDIEKGKVSDEDPNAEVRIYYLDRWKRIYDVEKGLDTKQFENPEETRFF